MQESATLMFQHVPNAEELDRIIEDFSAIVGTCCRVTCVVITDLESARASMPLGERDQFDAAVRDQMTVLVRLSARSCTPR